MIIYEVRALDLTKNKFTTFNHNLTLTENDAYKFAKHLEEDCREYFSNVTIIKSEYQLIKSTETKIGLHKKLKGGE